MEEPIALYITIQQVPQHRQAHDSQWHLAIAFQQEWEHERALEIVELEDQEEHQVGQFKLHVRQGPQVEHHHKHGHLHEAPSYFVIDGGSPFLSTHLAVSCIYKV